jgi:hypothetical protein
MAGADIDWPQLSAVAVDDMDEHLRLLAKVSFALEDGRSEKRARRLLAKAGGPDAEKFEKMTMARFSELRKEAEAIGALSMGPKANRSLFSPSIIRDIDHTLSRTPWRSLEGYLARESEGVFQKLIVVHSNTEAVIDYSRRSSFAYRLGQRWDSALAKFGLTVARHLYPLIETSKLIGLSWGQTCGSVVQGLVVHLADPCIRRHAGSHCIFPVAGAVESGEFVRLNATHLATRLRRSLHSNDRSLSLETVPCALPSREFHQLEAIEDYRTIFGDRRDGAQGLAWRADTIITSVGARHNPRTADQPWAVPEGFVGDIGGANIPEDLKQPPKASSEQLIWTGLTREVLQKVARRGRLGTGQSGVIMIAVGENKRAIARQAILDKAVTVAIIDEKLADGLESEMPEATEAPALH